MPADAESVQPQSCSVADQRVDDMRRVTERWFDLARRMLDATQSHCDAFYGHTRQLYQAQSPSEFARMQAEYVRSTIDASRQQAIAWIGLLGDMRANS